jgi:hypothetical protein
VAVPSDISRSAARWAGYWSSMSASRRLFTG